MRIWKGWVVLQGPGTGTPYQQAVRAGAEWGSKYIRTCCSGEVCRVHGCEVSANQATTWWEMPYHGQNSAMTLNEEWYPKPSSHPPCPQIKKTGCSTEKEKIRATSAFLRFKEMPKLYRLRGTRLWFTQLHSVRPKLGCIYETDGKGVGVVWGAALGVIHPKF